MSEIKLIKIRAEVSIGSLQVVTPYIQSFNVRKTRNQLSSFDMSLKVSYDAISGSNTGGDVVIRAGTDSNLKTIYTGIVKNITVSPCWDDPGFVILNASGTDILSLLEHKQYTRRCVATKSSWITIDGVEREGLRSGKFNYIIGAVDISPDGLLPPIRDAQANVAPNLTGTPNTQQTTCLDPTPIIEVMSIV